MALLIIYDCTHNSCLLAREHCSIHIEFKERSPRRNRQSRPSTVAEGKKVAIRNSSRYWMHHFVIAEPSFLAPPCWTSFLLVQMTYAIITTRAMSSQVHLSIIITRFTLYKRSIKPWYWVVTIGLDRFVHLQITRARGHDQKMWLRNSWVTVASFTQVFLDSFPFH